MAKTTDYSQLISDIETAKVVGTALWTTTASSNWTTTSDAWADMPANVNAPVPTVSGDVTVPDQQLPAIKVASAPEGWYKIEVQGHFASAQTPDSSFRLMRGADEIGMIGVEHSLQNIAQLNGLVYHDGTGDLDIKIQARDHGHTGGDNSEIRSDIYDRKLKFTVIKIPV